MHKFWLKLKGSTYEVHKTPQQGSVPVHQYPTESQIAVLKQQGFTVEDKTGEQHGKTG